jgi:hypothetical protein
MLTKHDRISPEIFAPMGANGRFAKRCGKTPPKEEEHAPAKTTTLIFRGGQMDIDDLAGYSTRCRRADLKLAPKKAENGETTL